MDLLEEGRGLLFHSCWLIETARFRTLEWRGHEESAKRAEERAEVVRRHVEAEGVEPLLDVAVAHTEWMQGVSGQPNETGAIGWFFLQRLGQFTDSHLEDLLPEKDRERMIELLSPDSDEVNASLARDGLPATPPAEWPEAPTAEPPGKVLTRFAIIGDPHLGIRASEKFIPAVVDDINREEVDFTVIVGDLTQSGKEEQFVEAKVAFDRLASPYVLTVGNHDQWGFMTESAMGMERFRSTFGREPNAIHESNGARVIVINSADPSASPFPPFDILAGGFTEEPNESVPGGIISEEVAEWMGSIEPAGPTLVFLHHPPYPYPGHPPIVFGLDEPGTNRLSDLMKRTGAMGAFCGHTHRSATYQFAGVPFTEVPSSKEWPFGYGIVELGEGGWAYNLRPVSATRLVEKASMTANVLIRRYARGPAEARSMTYSHQRT